VVRFAQCKRIQPRAGNRWSRSGKATRRWLIRVPVCICRNVYLKYGFSDTAHMPPAQQPIIHDDDFLYVEEFGMLDYMSLYAGTGGLVLMDITCSGSVHNSYDLGVGTLLQDEDDINGDDIDNDQLLEAVPEDDLNNIEQFIDQRCLHNDVKVGEAVRVGEGAVAEQPDAGRLRKFGLAVNPLLSVEEGWAASWCETRIWAQMLMLLMWEEIFDASLPRFYFRAFLNRPLDLLPDYFGLNNLPPATCANFYIRRKARIRDRLNTIKHTQSADLEATILQSITVHKGKSCYCIRWEHVNRTEIASCVRAMGGYALSTIFEVMLRNPETYFRGAPDLLFWKVCTRSFIPNLSSMLLQRRAVEADTELTTFPKMNLFPDPGKASNASAFAVEVKSANDKLSPWQTLWVELLVKARIRVEVFKVSD
jgi:hypothetical protein